MNALNWRCWIPEMENRETNDLNALLKVFHDRNHNFYGGWNSDGAELWNAFRAMEFAIDYVLFTRSFRWDSRAMELTTEHHTQECMGRYMRMVDRGADDLQRVALWRASWAKTACKKCHGWGILPGGFSGDYWQPPDDDELCPACLAQETPKCPRCGAEHTLLGFDEDGWPQDDARCFSCGWTFKQGGEPNMDGELLECTCDHR